MRAWDEKRRDDEKSDSCQRPSSSLVAAPCVLCLCKSAQSRLLAIRLLQLLLGSQLVGVSALLLAAVGGTRRQRRITLAANLLVALDSHGELTQRRLHHTTGETEHLVDGGVSGETGERRALLQLRSGVDETRSGEHPQTRLQRRHRVAGRDPKHARFTSNRLDKDLHC